ncbi:MAG: transglycosylase domain-containing protein [Chitinophagales bacterium]
MPEPSVLYDVHGRKIKSIYEQDRVQVSLDQVSDYVEEGFISAEDKNFYRHHGIDVIGILRAFWIDVKHGHVVAGGSTITQQTAKILYLTQERTFARKIKELFYTFALESRYTKDEILELYLNSIYFGEGANGIEAASRTYFGKSASRLSLAESTILVSIPRRPAYYDPYQHPDHAKERQKVVLDFMVKQKYITREEADQAYQQKLNYRKTKVTKGDAPYFDQTVVNYLVKKYGTSMVFSGGLRVFTTLDLDMQKAAQKSYDQVMDSQPEGLQAALVAVDTGSGQVRAMIGGRDITTAPFNRAVDGFRQAGSSFKPYIYSYAMLKGYTEATTIMCEPVWFEAGGEEGYSPTDYGNNPYHYRPFTLKEAIMISDNVVSVRLNEALGPAKTASHASTFGFKQPVEPYLPQVLGTSDVSPLEMANGYAVFANGGTLYTPMMITKITDRFGRVLQESQPQGKTVVSSQNAYLITDILQAVLKPGGTGSHLGPEVGRPAAGKTGTTQNYRDAWFVGYTPQISCAVWVGYDTQLKSVGIPGGQIAGPIWAGFMKNGLTKLPKKAFEQPSGITKRDICLDTGMLATDYCPRPNEMAFLSGTEPLDVCYVHQPSFNWWQWFGDEEGQPGNQGEGQSPGAQAYNGFRKWWKDILRR